MKPSAFYEFTVPAWGAYTLTVSGDYFKILAATGAVSVKGKWGELKKLIAGQGLEASPFDRLELRDETGAPNTIRLFIGDEKFIDGMAGSVTVSKSAAPQSSAFDNSAKAVTNASAQLIAENINRQYLLVQNNDASAVVYLAFGKAATVADGVRVVPGGFYELSGTVPTQAVHAIGSAANNPNVVVVEG